MMSTRMKELLVLTVVLLSVPMAWPSPSVTLFDVDFEADPLNSAPLTIPGLGGQRPTALFGDAVPHLFVAPIFGDAGASSAAGQVLSAEVETPGVFFGLNHDLRLLAAPVANGDLRLTFDFVMDQSLAGAGWAFMRIKDTADEDIAGLIIGFGADDFNLRVFDYDSETGEYLGLVSIPGSFAAGLWRRIELTLNLDDNRLRVLIDGQDQGIDVGLNRATGDGVENVQLSWGTAYVGRSAVDNFSISAPEQRAGLPDAPAAVRALLEALDGSAGVQRFPDADFRSRGLALRNSSLAELRWAPVYRDMHVYRFDISADMDEETARLKSLEPLSADFNGRYRLSALIRTEFPRSTWELNLAVTGSDSTLDPRQRLLGTRMIGLPAVTEGPDGWQRFTWDFTPHWPQADGILLDLEVHEYGPGFDGKVAVDIADIALIELPPAPLAPFAPGAGVRFEGGPGPLPMRIDGPPQISSETIRVRTLGTEYEFDRAAGQLILRQHQRLARDLAIVEGLPLAGLAVTFADDQEVVLVGADITIGVQADGAVVLSPHQPVDLTLENRIGGDFNRLAMGDLYAADDWGGITANLHVPLGTGRRPRVQAFDPDLPFLGIAPNDLHTAGAAGPGWRVQFQLDPGERLFVSAFPARAYDWAASFEKMWALAGFGEPPRDFSDPPEPTEWVLWNVNERAWAMSFGPQYVARTTVPFPEYVAGVAAAGDQWSAYFSQWFYYSRDPQELADEVARWRDEYGMNAFYADGLAQDDWLSAYRLMRLLRAEVLPEANLIIHDSFPQSGVAAAAFRPFLYSYATQTYMAENAETDAGASWRWPRYAVSQYGRANVIGVTKGDAWLGFEDIEKYLVTLVWGGRGKPQILAFNERYLPVLRSLAALWCQYGDDPNFFDRVYHPEAQRLTGYPIGRAGMPVVLRNPQGAMDRIELQSWTDGADIRYTLDGQVPDESSPLYSAPIEVPSGTPILARSFHPEHEPSLWAASGGAPVASRIKRDRFENNVAAVCRAQTPH